MENYVGKRLDGRYEILEIIGVGGMAVVYKAFDNIDERIVAVKILKDEFLENDEFRRRFKNESKAIAVLSHPNIVKVFDVSFGNMIQYIVMEYVEGITLKEYIQQQKVVNQREAVHFITQILRALQHAHDKGIVHRDVKPQNIMLISDGTIKVTDFGIAHFSRGETRTMSDQAIGSVHYISPEQARGSVTDAKADIYSAGVVLYEMLTGTLPFQSENAVSVALMQLNQEPKAPRSINPDIAIGLEQITIRSMQKNPFDRYQSSAEMLVDIEAFKKDPTIKFDYSHLVDKHFVDEQPTKFVPAVVAGAAEVEPPHIDPIEDDDADIAVTEAEVHSKKKTVAVLCGLLAVLVIFAVILISAFLPDNNSGKVTVPNFMGKNYVADIYNNSEYAENFVFQIEEVFDSNKDNGTVVGQEPSANKKVERGATIILNVVSDGSQFTLPDVYGDQISAARETLLGLGLVVVVEPQYNLEHEVGTVLQTSPAKGDMVSTGDTITVFVATDEDTKTVPVPMLIGLTIGQAKSRLEALGLKLDMSRTEYINSNEKSGIVVGNERVGEEVPLGTAISVFVSNGYVGEVEITFVLPATNTTGKVVVMLNDEVYEQKDQLLNGGTFKSAVRGNGSKDVVSVTIDGQLVYKTTANFVEGKLGEDTSTLLYTTTTESTTQTTTKPTTTEESTTTKPTTTKPTTTEESTTKEKTTKETTESTTKETTQESTKPKTTLPIETEEPETTEAEVPNLTVEVGDDD